MRKDLFLHVNGTHLPLPGDKQSLQNIKGTIYVLEHVGSGMLDKFALLMKLNYALILTNSTKTLIRHCSEMFYADLLKTHFSNVRKSLWP